LEEEAKRLVLECFHKWIQVFEEKASKWMPTRKSWDHAIETKEGFIPKKGKVYPLLRKEREEVHKFISEQLRNFKCLPILLYICQNPLYLLFTSLILILIFT